LPENVLRRFKVYAASQNQSMSSLMTRAINQLMENGAGKEVRKRRFLEKMRNAPDLGTGGVVPWTREELHER
jgi:hypothetical protein